MPELSGATEADVQLDPAPKAELVGSDEPDVKRQAPHVYAGLTAQQATKDQYALGLYPTGDKIQEVYDKALSEAQQYHAEQYKQEQAKALELQNRFKALSPQGQADVASGKIGLAQAEETEKQAVAKTAEQREKAWEAGPSAYAAMQQQPGGIAAGRLEPLSEAQAGKVGAYDEGFYALQKTLGLFNKVTQNNPIGAGGAIRSGLGLLEPLTNITSPEVREYKSWIDFNLPTIARAVQGDSAVGATKETIQNNMKEALPNSIDNDVTGGHKLYNLMDIAYHKVLSDRNAVYGKQDTSRYDTLLTNMRNVLESPEISRFNALAPQNQPAVQLDNSPAAKATIDSVNSAAAAGVNIPATQGAAANYSTLTSAKPPPAALASPAAQQAVEQKYQQAQQIPGKVGAWLQGLLPENWPQERFSTPRPWETETKQYVGTGQ